MSIVVTPPTANDTRSALADWIELQAVGAARGKAVKGTLSNVLDIGEDNAAESPVIDDETGEILDEAILEDSRSAIVAATLEELEYRQRVLGSSYPFSLDGARLVFEFADCSANPPGQVVYLFCLLASAIRERKLHPVEHLGPVEKEIANAFQICACLAAGGYVSGEVASFGFPRATGTAFLPALRDAFERFGMGEVRATVPDGLPQSLKDGGIDVIAWRNHPDGMPGKIYLLGQCASGSNWKEKSIVEYVKQLHGAWFTSRPATWSLPAMFIPFTLHHDLPEERRGPFLQALKNLYWYDEMRFGIVFDRLRIAHFAQDCLDLGTPSYRVDGADRFRTVQTWVEDALQLTGIRKAA